MKRLRTMFARATTLATVIVFALTLTLAQTTKPSSKGLVIKGKAPINKDVLKVNLPKAYETTLANGLQVIVLEQHKLPIFAMQMVGSWEYLPRRAHCRDTKLISHPPTRN